MIKQPVIPAILTAGLLTVLVLTGCTNAPSAEAEAAGVAVNLPAQDRQTWAMPLDGYVLTAGQLKRESYLHALISQRCISEQGFHHTVPSPNLTDEAQMLSTGAEFTEARAASDGYRMLAQAPNAADDAWAAYTQRPMSQDELSALDGCVRNLMADDSVPKWEPHLMEYAVNMGSAAVMGAFEDTAVKDSEARWVNCMSAVGIDDLPTKPSEMPTVGMMARYGAQGEIGADPSRQVPAVEKSDAVQDALCRESSGYNETLYQAAWDRQVGLLEANYDSFVAVGAEIEEVNRKMIEQVALLAPAQ